MLAFSLFGRFCVISLRQLYRWLRVEQSITVAEKPHVVSRVCVRAALAPPVRSGMDCTGAPLT